MKHKLILLNIVLAGVTIAAGWRLREDWMRDQKHDNDFLRQQVKAPPVPPIALAPAPQPFVGITYSDVAQKNLFSKDRNPNVIVEPVVVKVRPPMPALPLVYGVMGLPSGVTAIMAEKRDARSQGIKAGQSIGPFKVLALSAKKITLEWDGEKVEKNIDELVDRSGGQQQQAAVAAPAAPPAVNPANAAEKKTGPPTPAKPGVSLTQSVKACQPGDTSPAGTVVDGFKKVTEVTPFGESCRWIAAN